MAKMETCNISVEFALKLRNLDRHLTEQFTCVECSEPVEPHEAGGGHAAHFEHVTKNRQCSLGHRYEPAVA
jgi:hypothetical protein